MIAWFAFTRGIEDSVLVRRHSKSCDPLEYPPSFADALQATLSAEGKPCVEPVAKVAHKVIDGPAGPILLRIYTPQGDAPFPVVLYYHGGGFVIVNLDTYDASPRQLVNGASAIVVSVAYRRAPDSRFRQRPTTLLQRMSGYWSMRLRSVAIRSASLSRAKVPAAISLRSSPRARCITT